MTDVIGRQYETCVLGDSEIVSPEDAQARIEPAEEPPVFVWPANWEQYAGPRPGDCWVLDPDISVEAPCFRTNAEKIARRIRAQIAEMAKAGRTPMARPAPDPVDDMPIPVPPASAIDAPRIATEPWQWEGARGWLCSRVVTLVLTGTSRRSDNPDVVAADRQRIARELQALAAGRVLGFMSELATEYRSSLDDTTILPLAAFLSIDQYAPDTVQ